MATDDGKAAKARLEKMVKTSEGEFKTKLAAFKEMEEQLSKQVQLMSDEMKRQKLQEYQQKGLELQQGYQQEQQKLMQEQETAFEPIIKKLRTAIQGLGLSEGYTIILEKRGDGVLYAMPQLDLTAKVVSKYKSVK
jgi:outer membrane protein